MAYPNVLDPEQAALVVVDVQERLMPAIQDGDRIVERCARLIEGFNLLNLPVYVTEQYPKGLGRTVAPLLDLLNDSPIIEKREFGAFACDGFMKVVGGHSQLLLCGVEAHVCVSQTAHGALEAGHWVHVAVDAVGSRHDENRQIGLDKMRAAGTVITSTEAALFELLQTSEHPQFKAISKLIR